jgi:hypothetical protein
MKYTVTVQVPADRRVVIDLPEDFPVGTIDLEIRVVPSRAAIEIAVPDIDPNSLRKYLDTKSGEWRLVGRSGVVREIRNNL